MKRNKMGKAVCVLIAVGAALWPFSSSAAADPPEKRKAPELRAIRVAVFDFDVLKGVVELEPAALTDQVNRMLADMPKVTIVNRTEIQKVADEHKMVLTGLVDNASAVKLGKFLSAEYVVVGRASKIGKSYYLVMKLIDVQTTVQSTVSAKSPAGLGPEGLMTSLGEILPLRVRELQKPVEQEADVAFENVRGIAEPLTGKTIVMIIEESHVSRPLKDPAAQMAVAGRLRRLGINVIVPKDPTADWKQEVMITGKFGQEKVDYLMEGEGLSAFAGNVHGLTSCRARVELRVIALPGNNVIVIDKGVAASVDLVESLAAKDALEKAGVNACDRVVKALTERLRKPDREKAE
ncbi:MAG: hypothetical protein AMS16_02005 [Planctomycetes bacterium DG_58]|nr:MAG: hypothetical protein AMS16_02005 [Planctomycetes bacterium DG_58]